MEEKRSSNKRACKRTGRKRKSATKTAAAAVAAYSQKLSYTTIHINTYSYALPCPLASQPVHLATPLWIIEKMSPLPKEKTIVAVARAKAYQQSVHSFAISPIQSISSSEVGRVI